MKRHRRIVFVFLMAFCLMFTMMPSMAFAEQESGQAVTTETPDPPAPEEAATEEDPAKEDPALEEGNPPEETAEETNEEAVKPASAEAGSEGMEAADEAAAEGEALPEKETEEDSFDASRSDYLAYDPLYIAKYADSKYVDVSEISMDRFIDVVTAAKGIATYNVDKQNGFEFKEDNYLASMNYEMPVYNVDDDSKYYVAIPNINKFNSGFRAYGLVLGYNNDMAELIKGWKYEKGILYIPKSAVDKPKNRYETPEGVLLAIQMNYAIGDDMDFTKSIPVQILKKGEPVEKKVHTASIFDLEKLTVSTGTKHRDAGDISVFLNGQVIPISDDGWIYDKTTGEIQIFAMPGVVSSINIVFENQKILDGLKDAAMSAVERISAVAYAVTQNDMVLFKNASGGNVVVTVPSWMFVGWRGTYQAKTYWGSAGGGEAGKKKLKGWTSSINYLYGGNSAIAGSGEGWLDDGAAGVRKYESNFVALWSVASYATAADLGRALNNGTLTRDMLVEHYIGENAADKASMTIYEWMMQNRNNLKQSKYVTKNSGSGSGNGIGGANNFALSFPLPGSVITGCVNPADTSGNLVSDPNADGYNAGNPDFTFDVTGLGDDYYYYSASCNELVDAAASEGGAGNTNSGNFATTYVTCLGIDRSAGYAIFAFTQVRSSKQDATAIYKFRIKTVSEGPDYDWEKTAGFKRADWGDARQLPYQLTCKETEKNVTAGSNSYVDDMGNGTLSIAPDSVTYTITHGAEYFDSLTWTKDEATGKCTFTVKTKDIPDTATASGGAYVAVKVDYKVTVNWNRMPPDAAGIRNNTTYIPLYSGFDIAKEVRDSSTGAGDTFTYTVDISTPDSFADDGDIEPAWNLKGSSVKTTVHYDDDLHVSFSITLKNGQTAEIRNVPVGSIYTVTEAASSYIASYTVTADGSNPVIARASKANTAINTALSTDEEVLDGPDGIATIRFTNRRIPVEIHKTDAASGAELAGARMQVLDSNNVVLDSWTSTGQVHKVAGLVPGTYKLRELSAPYGYEIANDQIFTVGGSGTVSVTMKNNPVTVRTTAMDANTGKHVGKRSASAKITDTVHMTGLVSGRQYKLTGTLMNKRTGAAISGAAASRSFTATAASMDVTMDFTFDSTALADGDSVVVYETLYRTSAVHSETVPVELQKHQNINDADQTVSYPGISTTALDQTSGTKNMLAAGNAVIQDTVSYKGLAAGETYTLEGELFDKTANRLTGIKSTASLAPASGSGTAVITFSFDARGLENHTLVVYETLKLKGETLTEHRDPNDVSQTVYIPQVKTILTDNGNRDHLSNADETVTLIDTVVCSNLIIGRTYTVDGKLVYKNNGNDVLDNGRTVSASKTFTASKTTETQTLAFTFNGSLLQGKTVVAFEDLTTERKKVGAHADLSDENQSVHFPKVSTTALDSETGDHISLGDESITIRDTVAYENLIPGKTYTLAGTLMDKRSGKAVSGATAQPVQFRPISANGTSVVTFTFNGAGWKNHKTVAFEKLYLGTEIQDGNLIAAHEDLSDTDQTVNIPEAGTTLLDAETKDHIAFGDDSVTLIDTVAYNNLLVGKEYVAKGTLMNQKTGEPVKVNGRDVTGETAFKAESENGTVEVRFVFNGIGLPGETLVAFETIEYRKVPVAIHANINDKAQTVPVPKIRTRAAISDDNHVITDTISYENLLPDRKYVFRGWLVDTATGEKISGSDGRVDLNGGANTSGSVEMKMNTAGYDSMTGHSMTAFEELYVIETVDGKEKEIKVAEHKDRSGDQNTNPQTIEICHDLKIQKNVTGNLGDLTKVFKYTVEFTGLVPDKTYTVDGDDAKTFRAGSDGKASLELRIADDQEAVIRQLPKSATYKVTEAASDHMAEFRMFSEDMADKGARILTIEASNVDQAAKMLSTAVETVDLFDGTVVVLWENNRDLATLTGIRTYLGIWSTAFILAAAGLVTILMRHRRYVTEE